MHIRSDRFVWFYSGPATHETGNLIAELRSLPVGAMQAKTFEWICKPSILDFKKCEYMPPQTMFWFGSSENAWLWSFHAPL